MMLSDVSQEIGVILFVNTSLCDHGHESVLRHIQ